MKNCYCPVCGVQQRFKFEEPSKIILTCHACSRSLSIKVENGDWLVRAVMQKSCGWGS